MFGWIPIIGPVIDGIVKIFSKWQDTKLGEYTVDGKVDVEAMKTSANILATERDDIGVRLARDLIMFPTAVWTSLVVWDNIIVHNYPQYVIVVESFAKNPGLEYLPYSVLAFLFGAVGMSIWSRK